MESPVKLLILTREWTELVLNREESSILMPYQKFLDALRFKPLWREGQLLLELMPVDGHITRQGFSVTVELT